MTIFSHIAYTYCSKLNLSNYLITHKLTNNKEKKWKKKKRNAKQQQQQMKMKMQTRAYTNERINETTNIQIIYLSEARTPLPYTSPSVCVRCLYFSRALTRKWANCIQWNVYVYICGGRNFLFNTTFDVQMHIMPFTWNITTRLTVRSTHTAVVQNNIIIIYFALIFHDLMSESCVLMVARAQQLECEISNNLTKKNTHTK